MPTTPDAQPQQLVPTLGELLQFIPDAGQVYVQLAMEKWTSQTLREVHAAQMAQKDKQVVALQSALLAAGIDPNTLQAKGDPEVGATTGDAERRVDGVPVAEPEVTTVDTPSAPAGSPKGR